METTHPTLTTSEALELLPQKTPFLFADQISALSLNHAEGCYTFKTSEYFFTGARPRVPREILIETMGQIVAVPLCFFHLALLKPKPDLRNVGIFITDVSAQFFGDVGPLETVIASGDLLYFRRNRLRCVVTLRSAHQTVATCELGGMCVVA